MAGTVLLIQPMELFSSFKYKQSFARQWIIVAMIILGTGCSPVAVKDAAPEGHVDFGKIPDAIPAPIQVPLKNDPYEVGGIEYVPSDSANGYSEVGLASWYGTKFHGKQTANGEVYDMYKMTAAHKTLPLPSYVKVTNVDNGLSVVVRVNDRGPFYGDRLIDLSYVAALKLGYAEAGIANVRIEGINPESFTKSAFHKNDDQLIYLQLAAVTNFHSAQMLRRDVSGKLGVQAKVVTGDEDVPVYRVRIGPVESPDHLESILENLSSASYDTPWLVYEERQSVPEENTL